MDFVRYSGDFNGDGYIDLVVSKVFDYKLNRRNFYLYLHNKNPEQPYDDTGVYLGCGLCLVEDNRGRNRKIGTTTLEFPGDIDGNGLPDIAVMNHWNQLEVGTVQGNSSFIEIDEVYVDSVKLNQSMSTVFVFKLKCIFIK